MKKDNQIWDKKETDKKILCETMNNIIQKKSRKKNIDLNPCVYIILVHPRKDKESDIAYRHVALDEVESLG